MARLCTVTDLTDLGLAAERASAIAEAVSSLPADVAAPQLWRRISGEVLAPDVPFPVHRFLFERVYATWDWDDGPPPAWLPDEEEAAATNIGRLMQRLGLGDYVSLHRWSVENRDSFWDQMIRTLPICLAGPCRSISEPDGTDWANPHWLPGGRMNIAVSCFQAPPEATAVVWQEPGQPMRRESVGQLDCLSNRVANGLRAQGYSPGDALAVAMPMTFESVAIYLGIVKAGCVVVSISDSFSPEEIAKRLRIAGAKGVFTQDFQAPTGRAEPLYGKMVAAGSPPVVVVRVRRDRAEIDLRQGDLEWQAFLSEDDAFDVVLRDPGEYVNVLFSSGTTGDPKAIPWTHTTPIRAAADGHLHHDIRPGDVVAWPTNLGWMMGPWLVFAALVNRATIALYYGAPMGRGFGEFVRDAGVTMLGVVPSLVKSWRRTKCIEGVDWSRIRAFSSTGECSNQEDYLYLMMLAGYRPIIEYCGGTEIGGAYITGTVVQAASPGTFSTPALGLDVVILDDENRPARNGEVFLVPPSIGLSRELLNHDHHKVYYADVPPGVAGEVLRRHGDQMEALGGGYFRSHGRADDTMNLKGIKVSSAELERTLNSVEGVHETAAIAHSSADGGPSVLVVFAVLQPGVAISPPRLKTMMQQAIREQHSSLFKISDVRLADSLPRTASNKVMRRLLRDRYRQECPE